jgi:hypothetical protein
MVTELVAWRRKSKGQVKQPCSGWFRSVESRLRLNSEHAFLPAARPDLNGDQISILLHPHVKLSNHD